MKITDFLREDAVIIGMQSTRKRDSLKELLKALETAGRIRDHEKILTALMERENLGSTGIGQGIAVPHTKSDQVEELIGALGISSAGVEFDSLDGESVSIIFLVLAPAKATGMHLKALAKIARLLKDRVFRNSLKNAQTAAQAVAIIREDEEKLTTLA